MKSQLSEGSHCILKHWCQRGREGKANWLAGQIGGRWKSRKVVPSSSRFRSTSAVTELHPRLHYFLQKQIKHVRNLQMQRNQYFGVNGQITEIDICVHEMLTGGVLENRVNHLCQLIVSVSHCVIPSTLPRIKTKNFFIGKLFLKSLT